MMTTGDDHGDDHGDSWGWLVTMGVDRWQWMVVVVAAGDIMVNFRIRILKSISQLLQRTLSMPPVTSNFLLNPKIQKKSNVYGIF
jgi:hypothetical protein